MPIKIIAIGKKNVSWVEAGVNEYQKRLRPPFACSWELLPHSHLEDENARHEESQRILARIKSDDIVVLLDERGKQLSSPELSQYLSAKLDASATVVIVIGGAYGVDQTVFSRANLVWSLSKLVFPHQLVRVILIEQLYRAQQIRIGSPYHHE